jgi:hypothetical protein
VVLGHGGKYRQLPSVSAACPTIHLLHLAAPLPLPLPCVPLSLPCVPPPFRVPEKSLVQNLALGYWSFHYVKRLLETFFVHK